MGNYLTPVGYDSDTILKSKVMLWLITMTLLKPSKAIILAAALAAYH